MGRLIKTFLLPGLAVALLFSFPLAALFESRIDNITLPFAVLLAFVGATSILVMPGRQRVALLLATFGMVVFYVLARFIAPAHSMIDKIDQFALVLGLFGIATAWAMNRPSVSRNFLPGLIVLGGVATALLLLSPGEYQSGRLSFDNNNPIWMARAVGYLGLGAIGLYFRSQRTLPIAALLFLLSTTGIVMTASRGPLLGLLIAACIAAVFFSHVRKVPVLFFSILGTATAALVAIEVGAINAELFALGSRQDSADVRVSVLFYTLDMIRAAPEGIGVGWFMYAYLPYPHNIFLEVLVEWGWLVGVLFIAMTVAGGVGAFRLAPSFDVVKLLFVYEVVNASLSGDISSPRFLYALILIGNARLIYMALSPRPRRAEMPWRGRSRLRPRRSFPAFSS